MRDVLPVSSLSYVGSSGQAIHLALHSSNTRVSKSRLSLRLLTRCLACGTVAVSLRWSSLGGKKACAIVDSAPPQSLPGSTLRPGGAKGKGKGLGQAPPDNDGVVARVARAPRKERPASAEAVAASLSPSNTSLPPVGLEVWRPTPLSDADLEGALSVTHDIPAEEVAEQVLNGRCALFIDRFMDMTETKRALNERFKELEAAAKGAAKGKGKGKGIAKGVGKKGQKGIADAQRADEFRARRLDASQRLLIPTNPQRGSLALRGGPSYIGYLQLFYAAEGSEFEGKKRLVFRANDITAMNVAWQFFVNGVPYPFLDHKIHPFFGVYFTPTPYDHFLNLVDWLEARPELLSQPDAHALDLGTGSGVISLILRAARRDLAITASDMCPNAVFSARSEFERWDVENVRVVYSDLFSGLADSRFDLIVFNPPWMPDRHGDAENSPAEDSSRDGGVHRGNDYPPDLFPRLFGAAPAYLKPGGRLLVIFSDYAQRRGLTSVNPLEEFTSDDSPSSLKFTGVSRRKVDAGNRSAHRITQRDKQWALQQEYHAELWEFVAPEN